MLGIHDNMSLQAMLIAVPPLPELLCTHYANEQITIGTDMYVGKVWQHLG